MQSFVSSDVESHQEQRTVLASLRNRNNGYTEFLDYEARQSIPDRFRVQVSRHPNRLAVKGSAASYTYTELDSFSNRIAAAVLDRQSSDRLPVALFLTHDAPAVGCIFGILKAGQTYVPFDPALSGTRTAGIVEDTEVETILTDNQTFEQAKTLFGSSLLLNIDALDWQGESTDIARSVDPSYPAYIVYTSGSTGRPKGVVQTHENVLQAVRRHSNGLGTGPEDRVSMLPSFSVGLAVGNMYGAILNGASLFPFDIRQHGFSKLADWLTSESITVYESAPAIFRSLMQALPSGKLLPTIRVVRLGGDMAYHNDLDQFKAHFVPGAAMVIGYGCSEVSFVTHFYMVHRSNVPSITLPVGYASEGASVAILDDDGEALGPGLTGQIAISSAFVSPGYWNDLKQADVSRRNATNIKLYKTGDLGVLSQEGCLRHLGRKDSQVKIRGYRIELAEIETTLHSHLGVKEAVVVIKELQNHPENEDKCLVAHVVRQPTSQVTEDELRSLLSSRLPVYMMPSVFVFRSSLPISDAGKLNRSALAAEALPVPNLEGEAAITATEHTIHAIWTAILGHASIPRNYPLLRAGGTSISAIRIAARIRQQFNISLSIRAVFEFPTIATLSTLVEKALAAQGGPKNGREANEASLALSEKPEFSGKGIESHSVSSASAAGTYIAPASYAQQRMWVMQELAPESRAYNVQHAIRLRGSLDIELLWRSLECIIARHHILRTRLSVIDNHPIQVVLRDYTVRSPIIEWSDEMGPAVEEWLRAESNRPFDFELQPPWRVNLLRIGNEHLLVITVHHIMWDVWSRNILFRELSHLYRLFIKGRPSDLPLLAVQYADYALMQQKRWSSQEREQELQYWRHALSDLKEPALGTDHLRASMQSHIGERVQVILPSILCGEAGELARNAESTNFMLFLAVFYVLLHKYTQQTDISIGCAIADRTMSGTEALIGLFVNTIILRIAVTGDQSFGKILTAIRQQAMAAFEHQEIPFDLVVEGLRVRRSANRVPLCPVMFGLDYEQNITIDLPGTTAEMLEVDRQTAKLDLLLHLKEVGTHVEGYLEYDAALFEKRTILRMRDHFTVLLQRLVSEPDRPLRHISMLTEDERKVFIDQFNQTAAPS